MEVSSQTILYNMVLEVTDQWNVWMKRVFSDSMKTKLSASVVCKCLPALEKMQAVV
jgi:hypothetical protein